MKLSADQKEFLDQSISTMAMSEYFKKKSKKLGFTTIGQITERGWGELLKMDGFSYDWFNELVKSLDSKGLVNLLEKRE